MAEQAPAPPTAVISMTDVTKTYAGPSSREVLHATTLALAQGDDVSIVGRSGSGKTTLLHLMGLLDTPSSGSIRIVGVETGSLAEQERTRLRRDVLGFVFQAYNLIEEQSARDNVALPLMYRGLAPSERNERAEAALVQVGLGAFTGARVGRLSGGERQRVAIARALASEPRILLCDEPTGNLDLASSREFLAVLDSLRAQALTIVVVTHDEEVARRAAIGYELVDGTIRRRW